MKVTSLVPEKLRRDEPGAVRGLREAFERTLDDWLSGQESDLFPFLGDGHTPRVDVTESDDDVHVAVELPGLRESDIEVHLTSEYLTIKGEKREETEEKHRGYYRSERSFGAFRRDITLPCAVVAEGVTAVHKGGILTVTLPKSPEAKHEMKKIEVRTG